METVIFRCQFFCSIKLKKICITDKTVSPFSAPVIETGKVKTGCQMSTEERNTRIIKNNYYSDQLPFLLRPLKNRLS